MAPSGSANTTSPREPGVHMAHAAFDQNLPSARHLAPADGDLTQHC